MLRVVELESTRSGRPSTREYSDSGVCVCAVSYTHLDVYKRQSLNYKYSRPIHQIVFPLIFAKLIIFSVIDYLFNEI